MSHAEPNANRSKRLNLDAASGENQGFIPISTTEESSVPAANEAEVPQLPTTPLAEVQPAAPVMEERKKTSSDKRSAKPTRKPGRPRKEEASPDRKKQASLYLLPEDHKRLRRLCLEIDTSMTEFAEAACLDAAYFTYRCREPDCNCEFTMRRNMNDEALTPSVCPACQSKRINLVYKV